MPLVTWLADWLGVSDDCNSAPLVALDAGRVAGGVLAVPSSIWTSELSESSSWGRDGQVRFLEDMGKVYLVLLTPLHYIILLRHSVFAL